MYTGRVVDSRGTPVPHAGLLISSMHERGLEGIMHGWDADSDGNFTFKFPEKVRHTRLGLQIRNARVNWIFRHRRTV